MIPLLIALFIAGPIAEIALLLTVGNAIGVWPVIALCLGTAFLGAVIMRAQGLSALRSAEKDIAEGKVPVEAAADAVFLVVAAPLLMTPGFITDATGFLLLVPPVRRFLAREALKRLRRGVESGSARIHIRRF
jgi:UPF0716 protein FxsA